MTGPSANLIANLMGMVAIAEAAFRGRWRLSTLERVDPELHGLLIEQQGLYDRALVAGPDADAKLQAEAMVRGWRAAVARLEDPLRSDDAYLTGYDPATGVVVIIAEQIEAGARAQVRDGQKIITVTPDEVAKVFAGLNLVLSAKSLFSDAEVVGFAADNASLLGGGDEGDAVLRHEALKAVR